MNNYLFYEGDIPLYPFLNFMDETVGFFKAVCRDADFCFNEFVASRTPSGYRLNSRDKRIGKHYFLDFIKGFSIYRSIKDNF